MSPCHGCGRDVVNTTGPYTASDYEAFRDGEARAIAGWTDGGDPLCAFCLDEKSEPITWSPPREALS